MEYLMEAMSAKCEKENYAPITLIEFLNITDDNYAIALNILDQRYNHPVKMSTEQLGESEKKNL